MRKSQERGRTERVKSRRAALWHHAALEAEILVRRRCQLLNLTIHYSRVSCTSLPSVTDKGGTAVLSTPITRGKLFSIKLQFVN